MQNSLKAKTLSLVIPIYNEEGHLQKFLENIDQLDIAGFEKELVFVDDNSSDSSADILKKFEFRSAFKIAHQSSNQGKGAALRRGFAMATGDFIGVQDADFEYDPNEIESLLTPFLQNSADVVFGSRFKKNNTQVHRTYHYLANRFLTILSNMCSGLYLTDMETCYKFFKAEIIQNIQLESNRFGFEPEVTAKLARLKVKVHEVPISYFPRNYMEGKKITWRDGVAALRHIFYFNFVAPKEKFFSAEMKANYAASKGHWL